MENGVNQSSQPSGKKRILIQNAYGGEHEVLGRLTKGRHGKYCALHGAEYRLFSRAASRNRKPHWAKVDLLVEAMQAGYEQAIWLDTDCLIADMSFNLFEASGFGIAVCECFDSPLEKRHLNTGFMLVTSSPDVMDFLLQWRDSEIDGKWADQSAFIELMKVRPNRDLLTVLPNRFNRVAEHMDARDPFVQAFHGDGERILKMAVLVAVLERECPDIADRSAATAPA